MSLPSSRSAPKPPKSILKNSNSKTNGPGVAGGKESGAINGQGNLKGKGKEKGFVKRKMVVGVKKNESDGHGKIGKTELERGSKVSKKGEDGSGDSSNESQSEEDASENEDDDGSSSDGDDEMAIQEMKEEKVNRGKKRKRNARALSPSTFGSSLQHLISLPSTTTPSDSQPSATSGIHQGPAPSHLIPPSRLPTEVEQEKTRREAEEGRIRGKKRKLKEDREGEEGGRVRDVIGGWGSGNVIRWGSHHHFTDRANGNDVEIEGGAEREKRMKKLAQKGVVRLFNAIRAAQNVKDSDEEEEEDMKKRKTKRRKIDGEDGTPGQNKVDANGNNVKEVKVGTDRKGLNILGSVGKQEALSNLSKANFLQLIRSGTIGSK